MGICASGSSRAAVAQKIFVTKDDGGYLSNYPAAAHSACALIQRGEHRSHFDLLFVQQLPTHVHQSVFFAWDCGRVVVGTYQQLPGRRPLGLCFLYSTAIADVTSTYYLYNNYPPMSTGVYFLSRIIAG